MKKKLYQHIASSFQAYRNCEARLDSPSTTEDAATVAQEWIDKHQERIEELCREHLPHGSGFDCGTRFDFDASRPDKLVFVTDYHHMDENGYYDGWSEGIKIVIRPDWDGIDMRITGIRRKNRQLDRDYFYDTFDYHLTREVD